MKKTVFLFLLIIAAIGLEAQVTRYLITFKDKGTSPFSLSNPSQFLSQRSIDRRTQYRIAIDSTDLPLTPRYLDSLRSVPNVMVLNPSRWLNQVSIQTSDATALAKINSFSFVKTVTQLAARVQSNKDNSISKKITTAGNRSPTARLSNTASDVYDYGQSFNQMHIHNGEFLHNIGLRGQNMIIGVLDGGFFNYTSLRSFDSINAAGQVLDTWDFVTGNTSVTEDDAHGMQCLSVIGANIPGVFVGSAPKAGFYLFRSEDVSSEYPVEEHNWVCAAERVDSAGGNVISSSLGYNTFDAPLTGSSHTYAEMNGNTTTVAIGADLAAKKGILVVSAAGNEGNNTWHYIVSPADGDSVLAVAAVNGSGAVANFSSYGPSSDGQIKPDVASVGIATVVQLSNNNIGVSNGTSFACPNMAGLLTCLWQGFPEFNNIKIMTALRQSGSIYTTPNDRIGYGIPNVKLALVSLLKDFATATATVTGCKTTINWTSKDMSGMKYELERKAPGEIDYIKIGEQSGTGSLFTTHSYRFDDTLIKVGSGAISYRIRQIADTAAITFTADYMDTVSITSNGCITTAINPVAYNNEILIIPNPTYHDAVVRMSGQGAIPKLKIVIINASGQSVRILQERKGPGAANFTIPLALLAKGKYSIAVYDHEKLLAIKELLKL